MGALDKLESGDKMPEWSSDHNESALDEGFQACA
jgi:hypothetical protein